MTPRFSNQTTLLPAALAGLLLATNPSSAEVVFSESFESPVVSGFDENSVPGNGNWVGASQGFGASRRGLFNETVAWPATPQFSTPFGEQAYLINYTNSGLTTSVGTISNTLTQDVTYTVTFNAGMKAGASSADYLVELVAFDPADDNDARKECRSGRPGTVLASTTGTVTTTDMSASGSLEFTPDGANPSLGKEIGIRLVKASGSALYDNIRLIVGHDLDPTPADGVTVASGNVLLSWANRPPNTGSDTWVDVWFGTDPDPTNGTKVVTAGVDGQNTTSVTVNAPVADAYYWRIDSYVDGSSTGTPVEGNVFVFHVTDTDGDGFPDTYELANTTPPSNTALNPGDDLENSGAGDGLTNEQEYIFGTDPNDPDSDNDTLEDGPEIAGAGLRPPTSPLDPDSDGDGLDDNVETNTGSWVSSADTGTDPTDADYDNDGLPDGVETKTGTFVGRTTDTGTDPYLPDSDADGAGDWYEVAATFTDPNSDTETSEVPYPLPDPDPADVGTPAVPVKVYIMAGQSNMVGIGYVTGTAPGSLETITKTDNKFPNLIDGGGAWTERNDVIYKGVVTATAAGPLTAGQGGGSTRLGPELGFGHVMGWYHDEPVLLLKASQGNRSLGWDFLPPGSPQYVVGAKTYAGYGETPASWDTGTTPTPVNWYAGKQYDDCFLDEGDWAPAGGTFAAIENAADVLNGAGGTLQSLPGGPGTLNGRSYEIAGFVWWQGHKDHTDGVYAPRYEQNLVNLIDSLRTDFNAPNAPFVVGSIGFGGGDVSAKPANYQLVHGAQMAVGDPVQHPAYAGTVASVDTLPYWRTLAESPGGQDFHYNNNAETYTLVGDALGRAMLSLQDDVTPPFPDPMSFAIAPTAVDTSTVGMVATTASDAFGPVEYFFENVSNNENSGWITSASWNNTGLGAGPFGYRVKARDANGNETGWSATLNAAPGNDVTAPAPDPMSFATPPAALGESSITMTATTASDVNGVEYFFDSTTAGGNDSGWQDSPVYTDTGLASGTEFTYQVQARDKSSSQTATAFSAPASATTTAPDTTDPVVSTLDPADEASGVPVDANLTVTFDEDVVIGTGVITIKNLTDTTQEMIAIGDGTQVSLAGPVLTINPTADLAEDKDFAIQIADTAIDDLVGNSFVGIIDDTTWNFSTPAPPPVGLLFSEDFESPDVTSTAGDGDTNKTLPDNGGWVGATQGFGANRRGITDKAGGDFSTGDVDNSQAFAFRYTNSGLTTAEGVIGALAVGGTYTVTFDVVRDDGRNAGTPYNVQLIAFGAGAARDDCRSTPAGSTVLASMSGNAPGDGNFATTSLDFTLDAGDPSLDKDLGVRFLGATTSAIIDNVKVTSTGGAGGNDFADWIALFPGVGGQTGFNDDPDGDGKESGLENFFGTDPGVADTAGLVSGALSGTTFTFSHPQNPTPADDLTAAYQWSRDLDTFNAAGASDGTNTVTFSAQLDTPTPGTTTVTATVTVGAIPPELFVDVEVTQAP